MLAPTRTGFGKIATVVEKNPAADLPNTMGESTKCLCGSGVDYTACCKPHLEANGRSASPVQVIMSRYAAMRSDNMDYLLAITAATNFDLMYHAEQNIQRPERGIKNFKKKMKTDLLEGES